METEYYLAADKRFYEPVDRRPVAGGDYLDFVTAAIDGDWRIVRKGVWINCLHSRHALPVQGWKIHLSSVPRDAQRLLRVTASYLISQGVSFKFLADAKTLRMTNSKSWSRGAAGKFITVYPVDEVQFKQLLEELEPLTRQFAGPYILSDKRYKDSRVLYYRYGGIKPNNRLQPDGRLSPVLVAPDGSEVEDKRNPVYACPDWAQDPFPEALAAQGAVLNRGRYSIERALYFSITGGVYVAQDAVSGKKVVLKEARAGVHTFSDTTDAAALLRREYEMLERIAPSGVAPRPIELFSEWEHLFLAEEYLEGYVTIRKFAAHGCLYLETRPDKENVARYLKRDLDIVRKLAAIVDILHAQGVILGDISFNNILVHPETMDVKIVDLEGAHIAGSEARERIITPGFSDTGRPAGGAPDAADDYYGVGSVLLFLLTKANSVLELKPEAWREILAEVTRDFGLPAKLSRVVESLLGEAGPHRPKPSAALEEAASSLGRIGEIRFAAEDHALEFPREELSALVREGCRFLKANADLHRKDRLFPGDPLVYQTNPLNLAHGAAGVVHALSRIEGTVDPVLVDWILKAQVNAEAYPPGLSHGLAGIAWALLELGQGARAQSMLAQSFDHPLLRSSSDLYHGSAGWGMTNLKFWSATGSRVYLENAEKAGAALLKTAQERGAGLCWPGKDGVVGCGLGHGGAGIGLFLLYLDRALGGGRYEGAAVQAFEGDLAQAVEIDGGGLSWPRDDSGKKLILPYWKWGSAGVGIVALRFLKALRDPRYGDLVDKIHVDCDRKYANFPGRNDGLAGIGEFLLDAFLETRDPKYLNSAYKAARGLRLFSIQTEQGVAFPGNGLSRVSCDLATGSAGILLFLDRLSRPRPADFLLDGLLA